MYASLLLVLLFPLAMPAMQPHDRKTVQFSGSYEHMCCVTTSFFMCFSCIPGSSCLMNGWISGILGFTDTVSEQDEFHSYLLQKYKSALTHKME
jgi:hypothetical protein